MDLEDLNWSEALEVVHRTRLDVHVGQKGSVIVRYIPRALKLLL